MLRASHQHQFYVLVLQELVASTQVRTCHVARRQLIVVVKQLTIPSGEESW